MLFAIIAFSVFLFMHIFVYFVFFKKMVQNHKKLKFFKYFLVVNYLGILGYFTGRYYIDISQVLYFILSLPVGITFILFVSAILYSIFRIFIGFSIKRRIFFENCLNYCSGFFALSYFGYGVAEAALSPEIKNINIHLGLKKDVRAIQISDLHIGGLIEESVVGSIVDTINSLNPDIVFLTGDIVDAEVARIRNALDKLSYINAPLGIYYILGNHEYFHDISVLLPTIREMNIKILENENVIISKDGIDLFNLSGVYDIFGRKIEALEPNLDSALKERNSDLPTILLSHQPKFALEVNEDHNVDLILSGHTHGGQIFPFGLLVRLDQPYLSGLYQHNSKTKIYVNKGTGFWGPPIRVFSRAEITCFNLS